MRRSISRPVRYSRVRTSELTVIGAGRPTVSFATIFRQSSLRLGNYSIFFLQYQLETRGWPPWTPTRRPACSAPLIRQPISRPLVSPIGPVAATDVLRLRRLTHRNPRPRHAGISSFIPAMVFTIRHHVLGSVWIVLQKWNGADEIDAGREHNQHRMTVSGTDQLRAHHIPAAHGAARRNAGVVGMAEPHLAVGSAGNALGDRRAAVLLERGRVEHAIGDALAMLALGNALADFLGMKLQAHIRLAQPHPVPFAVAEHAAARQHSAVHGVIVLHNRPPTNRERRGRAPVH